MRMDQVTIRTARFEEEIAFYRDIVKLQIVREIHEGSRNIVFLSDGPESTCIEVIQNPEASRTGNPYLSVGFHTEDAERLRNELLKQGYEVSPMESPAPVVKFFFVKDPAGIAVQFVQGGIR